MKSPKIVNYQNIASEYLPLTIVEGSIFIPDLYSEYDSIGSENDAAKYTC